VDEPKKPRPRLGALALAIEDRKAPPTSTSLTLARTSGSLVAPSPETLPSSTKRQSVRACWGPAYERAADQQSGSGEPAGDHRSF